MFWVGLCVERAGLSAVDGTECWKWVALGNEGRAVIEKWVWLCNVGVALPQKGVWLARVGGAFSSSCLWGQGQLGGGRDAHPALQAGTLVLPLHRWPLWLLQVLGPQRRALR